MIRHRDKAADLEKAGATIALADAKNLDGLKAAFWRGNTLFLLTPEDENSEDLIGETKTILHNYRKAAEGSGIETIVGLSSMGAQHAQGTGNLQMSYLLEHAFNGLSVKQVFIRPAYYFSNWLPLVDVAKKEGILPTFFPVDMALPMVAPDDVADLVTKVLVDPGKRGMIYEIKGPADYTPGDIAHTLSAVLNKPVKAVQTPRDQWPATLKKMGMTANSIKNFIEMTEAVIDGRTKTDDGDNHVSVNGNTTASEFFKKAIPVSKQ